MPDDRTSPDTPLNFDDLVAQTQPSPEPDVGYPGPEATALHAAPAPSDYTPYYEKYGQKYGLDPNLLRALVATESGGNPNAVSPTGVRGLTQVTQKTANDLGLPEARTNVDQGVEAAAKLLRENFDRYGNPYMALAAYNAGTHQDHWGPDQAKYVQKIAGLYQQYSTANAPPDQAASSDIPSADATMAKVQAKRDAAKNKPAANDSPLNFDDIPSVAPAKGSNAPAAAEQQAPVDHGPLNFDDIPSDPGATADLEQALKSGFYKGIGHIYDTTGELGRLMPGVQNALDQAAAEAHSAIYGGPAVVPQVPQPSDAAARRMAQLTNSNPGYIHPYDPNAGTIGGMVDSYGNSLAPTDPYHPVAQFTGNVAGGLAPGIVEYMGNVPYAALEGAHDAYDKARAEGREPTWGEIATDVGINAGGRTIMAGIDALPAKDVLAKIPAVTAWYARKLGIGVEKLRAGILARGAGYGAVTGAEDEAQGKTGGETLQDMATNALIPPAMHVAGAAAQALKERGIDTALQAIRGSKISAQKAQELYQSIYPQSGTVEPPPRAEPIPPSTQPARGTGPVTDLDFEDIPPAPGAAAAPPRQLTAEPGAAEKPESPIPTPPPAPEPPAAEAAPHAEHNDVPFEEAGPGHVTLEWPGPPGPEAPRAPGTPRPETAAPPVSAAEEIEPSPAAPSGSVPQTTPEPVGDLRAQIADLVNHEHPRDAVFVARANEGDIPSRLPSRVKEVMRPEGTLLTTNYDKAVEFQNEPVMTDGHLAHILSYPQPKGEALESGDPVVTQAVDDHGNVTFETLTSPDKVGEAVKTAQEQAPGTQVHVVTPDEAQARRAALVQQEQREQTPAGIVPTAAVPGHIAPLPATQQPEKKEEPPAAPVEEHQTETVSSPPAGERPVDHQGNPIFEKGERVVIGGNGPLAGRHGVISHHGAFRMAPIFGGGASYATHTYQVRTDNGHNAPVSPAELKAEEPGNAPAPIMDPIVDGQPIPPQHLAARIDRARSEMNNAASKRHNARSPKKEAEWARAVDRINVETSAMQKTLEDWKETNPEEAARIFPPKAAPLAPAAGAVPVDSRFKPIVESRHTKKGHQLFVVQTTDRIEPKTEFNRIHNLAKRRGGQYSYFAMNGAIPGFEFRTREAAEKFLAEMAAEKGVTKPQEAPAAPEPEPAPIPHVTHSIVGESPDHPDWAKTFERDVGGHVVYSDPETALIQGSSALSGKPVFMGISRFDKVRTKVDIDSYTGDMFTPEQEERLKAAKHQIIAADEAKYHQNPEGPFKDSAKIAASDGVPQALVDTAKGWIKMLGITGRVFITTPQDSLSLSQVEKYGLHGPYAAIRSAAVESTAFGHQRTLNNGDHYIMLKIAPRMSRNLETLAHEIGHILEKERFEAAPAETRKALMDAYQAWLSRTQGMTIRQHVESMRAHTSAKQTSMTSPEAPATTLSNPGYWRSFSEYFADQTARWATSAEKPVSVIEKFFKRIADALRRLYSSLIGKKFAPAKEFKDWLDSLAEESDPAGIKDPEPETHINPWGEQGTREFFDAKIRETGSVTHEGKTYRVEPVKIGSAEGWVLKIAERGIVTTLGGVAHQGLWSRDRAIDEALHEAFGDENKPTAPVAATQPMPAPDMFSDILEQSIKDARAQQKPPAPAAGPQSTVVKARPAPTAQTTRNPRDGTITTVLTPPTSRAATSPPTAMPPAKVSADAASQLRHLLKSKSAKLRDQMSAVASNEVDPEEYANFKPIFDQMVTEVGGDPADMAATIRTVVFSLVSDHGMTNDEIRELSPYLRHYINEAQNGQRDDALPPGAEGEGPESVPGTGNEPDVRGPDAADPSTGEPTGEANVPSSGDKSGGRKRPARGGRRGKVDDQRGLFEPPGAAEGPPDPETDPNVTGNDYRITPGALEEARSPRQKAHDNLAAIKLAKQLTQDARLATAAEQTVLAKYVGWGGLPGAFPDSEGLFRNDLDALGAELQNVLSPEEYQTARNSTQFAHYTAEHVISSMWQAVQDMGFRGGMVFEPGMGVGHFRGLMPDSVASRSSYRGVEYDGITATIAKLLYPQSGIQYGDFTKVAVPQDMYDLVIGNPPFSDTRITADPKYAAKGFMLHDYFFAKSIDAVRPGGLLAFVTSAGTMNKLDNKARMYIAERAKLLGGIRLPSSAFKENAGTEVTTDILFFQRRPEGIVDRPGPNSPEEKKQEFEWLEVMPRSLIDRDGNWDEANVSSYFSTHPQMVLGQEGLFDKLVSGPRYGVRPLPGRDLAKDLREAIRHLPMDVYRPPVNPEDRARADFASPETKDGSFYVHNDGRLMVYGNGVGLEVPRRGPGVTGGSTPDEMKKIRQLIPIRNALRDVFKADLEDDEAAGTVARKALNQHYDAFVKEHGPINLTEFQVLRPTIIQQEGERLAAREEARERGEDWDDGTFDVQPYLDRNDKLNVIAAARQALRDQYAADGLAFDEGTFDPAEMEDIRRPKYPNVKMFMRDPESYRVRSIEHYDEETKTAKKREIFFRNVRKKELEPDLKTAGDGVLWSLNQFGRFDLDEIAEKMGQSRDAIIKELGDNVFEVPYKPGVHELAELYLSGDVVTKLEDATNAAKRNSDFEKNVLALQKVQPVKVAPSDIHMVLGMPWIPMETVNDFVSKHLRLGAPLIKYFPHSASWTVEEQWGQNMDKSGVASWGTDGAGAYELLAAAMNRQCPRIYDPGPNKTRVFNEAATQGCQDKINEMLAAFGDYLDGNNDGLKENLAELYNDAFNRIVERKFDGSYMTTPGIADNWSWRPHQTRVMARIVQTGNTYMAHAVGAGKTSAMIGAAMEMKRLGLVRKSMICVPNHMLGQFAKEFYEQYPTANIMVADDEAFHTDRRRQFISNVATQDLDAVIITHSSFGKVPISSDYLAQMVAEEIENIERSISEAKGDRHTVKMLENMRSKLEQKLTKTTANQDKTNTFEELGVDFLFVDEAHLFRKLSFATKIGNIKGVTPQGSDMSWDLFTKMRYLDSQRPGRSAVLASGTPITNTMAELYSLSKYLQPGALAQRGVSHFDAWSQTFGTTGTTLEPQPDGSYKPTTRFSKFVNIPELYKMVSGVMDIVTPNALSQYVVRPRVAGTDQFPEGRELHLAPSTKELQDYQRVLAKRMAEIAARKGAPQKGDDIILSVISDGRFAALDTRFVQLNAANNPDSKLNTMIQNVIRIYHETTDHQFYDPATSFEEKSFRGPATQMIFCNMGVNGRGPNNFSAYKWMKAEFRRAGIPENEIADIGDYKTSLAKQRLFNDMNEGKVRVLIGSVQKMGTGVNAQRRLYALHNVDPLWYPADDEQRLGRIIRQGNHNPQIEIHDYSTTDTYDNQMWGMMGRKGRFIEQFFRGDPNLRDMEDLGEAGVYEQAAAMGTSDPRVMQLVEARQEYDKALRRRSAFERSMGANESALRTEIGNIARTMEHLAAAEKDAFEIQDTRGDKFKIKIGDHEFINRKEAAAALGDRLMSIYDAMPTDRKSQRELGSIGGLKIIIQRFHSRSPDFWLEGEGQYSIRTDFLDEDRKPRSPEQMGAGLISSSEIKLRQIPDMIPAFKERIETGKQTQNSLREALTKTFTGDDEITALRAQVKELEAALRADQEPTPEEKARREAMGNELAEMPGIPVLKQRDRAEWVTATPDRSHPGAYYLNKFGNAGLTHHTGSVHYPSARDAYIAATNAGFELAQAETKAQEQRGEASPVPASALLTPGRIDREISISDFPHSGRSRASIAWISPEAFLKATTPGIGRLHSIQKSAGPLDIEKISRETQTPFLEIHKGAIVGHEGRHRMAALAAAGVERVPVILDYRHEGPTERIPQDKLVLSPQFVGRGKVTLETVIPLRGAHRDVIEDEFGSEGKNSTPETIKFQRDSADQEPREYKNPTELLGSNMTIDRHVDETDPEVRQVVARINQIVEDLFPGANSLAVAKMWETAKPGDKVTGAYFGRTDATDSLPAMEHLIAWALNSVNPEITARHEGIHYLRRAGLLTNQEWQTLADAAIAGEWVANHEIPTRYPDLSHNEQIEEAIADQFARYRQDPGMGVFFPSIIQAIFRKIADFLRRVALAVREHLGGDATANDIFDSIDRGEVGRRPFSEKSAPASDYPAFQREEPPTSDEDPINRASDSIVDNLRDLPPADADKAVESMTPGRGPKYRELGAVEQYLIFPDSIAKQDSLSSRFWGRWKERDQTQHRLISQARQTIAPTFLQLSPIERDHVYGAMELDRIYQNDRTDDGTPLHVHNTASPFARHTKMGDSFDLTPRETKAYFELRKKYENDWTNVMAATASKMGWDAPWKADVGENLNDMMAAKLGASSPSERRRIGRILDLMTSMDMQRRRPYIPLMRFGDYYIAAKSMDHAEGEMPETHWFELAEESGLPDIREIPGKIFGRTTYPGQVPKYAQARLKAVQNEFDDGNHEVIHGYLINNPEILRELNIPAIEKLFMLTESGVLRRLQEQAKDEGANKGAARAEAREKWEKLYDQMLEALHDEMYEQMKAGFKKHADVIPGYSADFDRVTGAYMGWIAKHVANLHHGRDVDAAYDRIMDRHPHKATKLYWQNWKRYQEDPTNIIGHIARSSSQVGFLYTMAGNISSSFPFATHTPLFGHSNLAIGLGIQKSGAALYRALGEAYAHMGADLTRGIHINVDAVGKTPEERAFLRKLVDDGTIHSALSDEMRALDDRQIAAFNVVSRSLARGIRVISSNISGIDEANRTGLALAAFRLAQDPENLKALDAAWSAHNEKWNDMVREYGLTPEAVARFLFSEGAFEWGRMNTPPIARGLGQMLFFLHGFVTRALADMLKKIKMGGAAGAALTILAAGIWLTAGIEGFPFVVDAMNFTDFLGKQLFEADPMLEFRVRQLLASAGFGKVGAEMIMRGPASTLLGIDLASRVGFGDIISREMQSGPVNAMGTVPSILYNRYSAVRERMQTHQSTPAIAGELLPALARNPMSAVAMDQEGLKSRRGKIIMPRSELSTSDLIEKAAGFTPLSVERKYQENNYQREASDLKNRMVPPRDPIPKPHE